MKQHKISSIVAFDGTRYDVYTDGDGGKTFRRNPPKPYRNRHEQKALKRQRHIHDR